MRIVRRVVILAGLAAVGLLVVLSVVGAFLGAERARAMFNSPPLVAFWLLLAGLLVAGLVAYGPLRRSPALAAVHLGALLVVVGGILGSDAVHTLARRVFGVRKLSSGYMVIGEGEIGRELFDADGRLVGELPFALGLEAFRVEYYRLARPWRLGVDAPGPDATRRQAEIDWAVGRWSALPFTSARVKVLRYLPSARSVYEAGAGPRLEVVVSGQTVASVPAEAGRTVSLGGPVGTLRVLEVFANLQVCGGRAVDAPGHERAGGPAVKVEFRRPDGRRSVGFVFAGPAQPPGHGALAEGLELRYVVPRPSGAEADPASGLPAMQVLLEQGGLRLRSWLVAGPSSLPVSLRLDEFLGPPASGPTFRGAVGIDGGTYLVLFPPRGPVRECKSHLVVFDGGKVAAEKVVKDNDPLHYGGYHFYQCSWDDSGQRRTILFVKSDWGLWSVYAGFVLLCAGVFGLCWWGPVWQRLGRRRARGG